MAQFITGAFLDNRVSSVKTTKLSEDFRLDSEHYEPKYLRIDDLLENLNAPKWEEIEGDFIIGPFGSAFTVDRYVESSHYRYIRGKDVKPFFLLDNENAYMTKEDYERLDKYALQEGDLLVSVVGTLGNVALVNEQVENAIFSCKSTAYRSKSIDPFYLTAYLNSSIGQAYLQRKARGTIQLGLNLPDLKSIPIYLPSDNEQQAIGDLIRESWRKLTLSKDLYGEAEDLLLAALGLDGLDLSPQLSYTAMFDEVETVTRFDSDYFQPKYQYAMQIMGKSGKKIKNVAQLSKERFSPQSGETFEYIEISDVTNEGRVESSTVMGEDAPSRAQFVVKTNDVITSTVRPIRRLSALVEPEQEGFVCSSGFAVLKPYAIEPELLLVYLRLPIVAEILDLHTTATMYPAISTFDLMNIPITSPDETTSKQIVTRVQDARKARLEAKQLLETAKKQVEQMILKGDS